MADTRLSDLASASALSASDLFYVVQSAGSGGEKATGTQLLTLVGTTYVAKSGGTMTGALTIASGTLTIESSGLICASALNSVGTAVNYYDYGMRISSTGLVSWTSGNLNGTVDLALYRDAAATLAQRNGTTQQIFRLYNTYTDASNYERLTLTGVAGTSVNLTAETLGTGGDNIDIVLTPAGTGAVQAKAGLIAGPAAVESVALAYGGEYGARMFSSAALRWTAGNISAGADVAIRRSAAGVLDVDSGTAATYRDLKLRNLIQTEYSQLTEMTAPAAPATNSVRIYAEDNGSGKTRLMALFATGAAQQIAIEP